MSKEMTKYKYITKKKHDGNWPFHTCDSILIIQRQKLFILIMINGIEYALNGLAAQRYNLEFPHEAKLVKIGISIDDFIKIGMEL